MDTDLLEEQIIDLIENKKWDEVRQRIVHWRAPDISTFMMDLGHNEDLLSFFGLLPIELAAEVFSELNADTQEYILANITDEQIKKILLELEVDDRTELFEDIRQYDTQKLLELLPQEERTETMHLLDYPESSVGRLMTTDFIAVRASWTITECLTYIRRDENKEKLSDVIYVTDNNNRLVDYVNISDFIFGDDESSVESLLDYNVVKLSPTDDREKAIELINHYHLIAVPVTDEHNILIGTVTFDDVMDVYREEVTEDFHLTSAIQPLERSYVTTRALSLFAKRTPWLLILVAVNLLSGTVIAAFEGIIAKSISLIAFLPLLVASAGNAGSQSSTLIIRAMAMNELSNRSDAVRILLKDLIVSVLLGLCLAVGVYFVGWYKSGPRFGIVISIAMFCLVIMGDMLGTLLPFVFKWFKLDPAIGSSPLVTSLADILGGLIYFSLAAAILVS
ncbi:MAG: magnesium transporter [Spirochaetales bacterium]|nr:magnesium transporter [Spirochaetales bacterium]